MFIVCNFLKVFLCLSSIPSHMMSLWAAHTNLPHSTHGTVILLSFSLGHMWHLPLERGTGWGGAGTCTPSCSAIYWRVFLGIFT